MKYILSACLIILCYQLSVANIPEIGDPVPAFELNDLTNAPAAPFHSSSMKNKIFILEFWATWCGPCIPAIDHLHQLQSRYPGKVQVIAISSESEARLSKFPMRKYPSLWFARDDKSEIQKLFGASILPHSILIDKNGKIVAITTPDKITDKVINTLLEGGKISLEQKTDDLNKDYSIDYFKADPTTEFSINLRTYRQGYPTYSKERDSIFGDRRITCINFTVEGLYRFAFQKNLRRTEFEADKRQFSYEKENLYCFDLIVPQERADERYGIMQQYLNSILPVNGRIESKYREVYVLKKLPTFQERNILSNDTVPKSSFTGPDFQMKGSQLDTFISYLENEAELPVVNETGLTNLYDISFSYNLAESSTFIKELNQLGFTLEKGKREIDVLIIYE